MIKFTDWLRNKHFQGSIKPATTPPSKVKDRSDDLKDAWLASSDSAGLSPNRRVQLLARHPEVSDERLKEIEGAWRS